MIKKLLLRLSFGSVLLSSLLYLTVPPASASAGVDWLHPWAKRAKITINSTNINATLTNFPVLIHLSTNSGENAEDVSFVFDELGTNANQKKIAVTTSNGTTQCYVEIEEWIHANEQAWLWAKVPNVASNADTDLYIYYDNGQPDNTNYVGDPDSTPAENVWDTNFVMVQHMKDETTSNTLDSTSNNNDGDKKGANEPQEGDGKIGKAQNFDGTDDWVNCGTGSSLTLGTGSFALMAWVKLDVIDKTHYIMRTSVGGWGYRLFIGSDNKVWFGIAGSYAERFMSSLSTLESNKWYFIVGDRNTTLPGGEIYINGILDNYTNEVPWGTLNNISNSISFGIGGTYPSGYFDGIIDEVCVYNKGKTASWIKADYETQRDHLLDFGVEENRPPAGTVMSIK